MIRVMIQIEGRYLPEIEMAVVPRVGEEVHLVTDSPPLNQAHEATVHDKLRVMRVVHVVPRTRDRRSVAILDCARMPV